MSFSLNKQLISNINTEKQDGATLYTITGRLRLLRKDSDAEACELCLGLAQTAMATSCSDGDLSSSGGFTLRCAFYHFQSVWLCLIICHSSIYC